MLIIATLRYLKDALEKGARSVLCTDCGQECDRYYQVTPAHVLGCTGMGHTVGPHRRATSKGHIEGPH